MISFRQGCILRIWFEKTTKRPPELKNTPALDHKSSDEIELERIEGQLRTVQLALEILTSVCASLPDPEEGGEPGEGKFHLIDIGMA